MNNFQMTFDPILRSRDMGRSDTLEFKKMFPIKRIQGSEAKEIDFRLRPRMEGI